MRFLVLEKGEDKSGNYTQELISTIIYIKAGSVGARNVGKVNSDGLVVLRFDSYNHYLEQIVNNDDIDAIVVNVGEYGSILVKWDDIAYITSSEEVTLSSSIQQKSTEDVNVNGGSIREEDDSILGYSDGKNELNKEDVDGKGNEYIERYIKDTSKADKKDPDENEEPKQQKTGRVRVE